MLVRMLGQKVNRVTKRGRLRTCEICLSLIFLVTVVACGSDHKSPPLGIRDGTSIEIAGPAPLARFLRVESTLDTKLEVFLNDGSGHSFVLAFPHSRSVHEVLLLGLRPGRTYESTILVTDVFGRTATQAGETIVTEPLPPGFPSITLLESLPARMEPGWTLIEALRRDRTLGYLVVIDNDGQVVWYLETNVDRAVITRVGDDGLLLALSTAENIVRKIDFAGNVQAAWHAAGSTNGEMGSVPFDGANIHHDIYPLPDGSFLTSTRESLRQVDDYPLDENDPSITGTVTIREEPVIQFGDDGQLIGKWEFLDILKPTRIAFNGTQGQPNATDWVHLNGIWYDERDDSIIASLRHQDAVVKISRVSGELIWILGPHDNWEGFEQYLLTPINSPFAWQYHQHSPMLTNEGTLLLFDNGNNRASPFSGETPLSASENFSRAVEFRIDEQAMTVEQVWEYGLNQSGEVIYTPFIGDADSLPETGNVLVTFGGICMIDGIPSDNVRDCHVNCRIIEVERDGHAKVFDVLVDDAEPTSPGYQVYRSDRFPSLYPGSGVTLTETP